MFESGSLFFPVTPFGAHGRVDSGVLRAHLDDHMSFPVGAVFAACGSGEFHSLNASEVAQVVETVRKSVVPGIPVIGPAGGPLAHALECARRVRAAGADALLVLAPYSTGHTAAGHARYLERILVETDLPGIVYHRPEAPLAAETVRQLLGLPQFVGFKDGVGDLAQAQELMALGRAHDPEFIVVNGLSLAEGRERDYATVGVPRYTSAAFTMDPRIGTAYLEGRNGRRDEAVCDALLDQFFRPMKALRDRSAGYAISLVKAAVRSGGRQVGPVRPPLVDLNTQDYADMVQLMQAGRVAAGCE